MKKTAIALYIAACIVLITVLCFASGVSERAIDWFEAKANAARIDDVTVELDYDELLAGSSYRPLYTPIGDIRGDAGLIFTSLDPEHLTVTSNGVISSDKTFEGDVLSAEIKITSKYDKDFEKRVRFTFVKKYPESCEVSYFLSGYGYGAQTLYTGVPVYVFSTVTSENDPNMTDYELIYDTEHFERREDGGLIPVKATLPGEKTSFSVRYGNGLIGTSEQIEISELTSDMQDVDEIRIENSKEDFFEIKRGESLVINLYSGGERIASDFTLSFDNGDGVSMSRTGNPRFNTAGEIYMTVTAPNGFSRTVRVSTVNVISPPIFTDSHLSERKYIEMLDTDTVSCLFTFDTGTTYDRVEYEYDKNIIQLTSDARSFRIIGKSAGTTVLKLIVDDGFQRVEDSITVRVEKDTRLLSIFRENVKTFVPKILGHFSAFILLAVFAMNMFKYSRIRPFFIRFPIYLLTGLWVAVFTEYLQTVIPDRTGSARDVLIDMTGFLVGTVLIVLLRLLFKAVRLSFCQIFRKHT